MARARQIAITTVCAAGLLGVLSTCKPDATPRAEEAEAWITKFYSRYDIRGGWGFFGAEAKDKNVMVEINVPAGQTADLLKFGDSERVKFIARNACPPKKEEVWSMLDEDGDIIIHARNNGNVFADVSCRTSQKGFF